MSAPVSRAYDDVRIQCKANVYFDGKVVSHSFTLPDGSEKSAGLIYPGAYTFNTAVAERMEIIAGACRVKVAGEAESTTYTAGEAFDVPAQSSFEIAIESGITEYICSYQ